jgi:hypothetical protein
VAVEVFAVAPDGIEVPMYGVMKVSWSCAQGSEPAKATIEVFVEIEAEGEQQARWHAVQRDTAAGLNHLPAGIGQEER